MCEYCEDKQELVGDWIAGAKSYASVRILDGVLCLNEYADWDESEMREPNPFGGCKLQYCPMCGQRL